VSRLTQAKLERALNSECITCGLLILANHSIDTAASWQALFAGKIAGRARSKFYQAVKVLPSGQSFTKRSKFYQTVKVLPGGQSFTRRSKFYQAVKVLPGGQSFTKRSKFYQAVKVLPGGQS
jgi:hypothetical protein